MASDSKPGMRKVTAVIPETLYRRLVVTKTFSRKPLNELMREGLEAITERYRAERDQARTAEPPALKPEP